MAPNEKHEHPGELAERFETHRARLRSVAYRMLGSLSEADDAVQETWLRLARSGAEGIENLGGWLTTTTARVCLDALRVRKARREDAGDPEAAAAAALPDPIAEPAEGLEPEQEAVLADSVGMALLVVLETLAPAERLAFVLHDMFAFSFDEIASIVGRSPAAARQLASRARRRIQGAPSVSEREADRARQREVVTAFLAASRAGDFDALLAVLDPDVVLRADRGRDGLSESREVRGATLVAKQALAGGRAAGRRVRPALVNGSPGFVVFEGDRPFVVMGFTIARGKVVEIYVLGAPERLQRLDLSAFRD
jgi:RNA polymerase sigma factor (sigma-70 family)